MQLRELNVGCFGGGTGLPSLLGGLKRNPWLQLHAVVTMFDSGGSSGQLRDQLGVLPPGDVLKCALALSRNEGEARRVLLSRLPTLEHAPVLHPAVGAAIRRFDAAIIGPGSFYTSLMPPLLVEGVAEALADVPGPIILIANLLTEGRGMSGFTAGDAVRRVADALKRPVDVVIVNTARPSQVVLAQYQAEHKAPLPVGQVPADCEVIEGEFWQQDIARHDRRRLSYAVWAVLAKKML